MRRLSLPIEQEFHACILPAMHARSRTNAIFCTQKLPLAFLWVGRRILLSFVDERVAGASNLRLRSVRTCLTLVTIQLQSRLFSRDPVSECQKAQIVYHTLTEASFVYFPRPGLARCSSDGVRMHL